MDDFSKQPTLPPKHIALGEEAAQRPVPDQIGPYRIDGLLSRGGMSLVYLATDPKSHDPIAVKVLAPKFVHSPEMVTQFRKEAEIIALTNHPNIIKLHGIGEWEEGVYLAVEFVQGISLRQFILQHPMSLTRAIEVTLQIASALHHLHTHRVIHRDLKPENVLLTGDGGVKVIDFGIAQVRGQNRSDVTGTPVYMPPEQKRDAKAASESSDIYALGLIAYEMILGRLSHGNVQIQLMPKPLQPILAKCLQPNPEERYQHISELIEDLNGLELTDERAYSHDLASHLRKAQEELLPAAAPTWPGTSVGIAHHRDLQISGIYFDFLDLEEGLHAVIMSEPSSVGIAASLHSALLQGMVHAVGIHQHEPEAFVAELNQLICDHTFDQLFTLNYLILNPAQNQLHYISCGYGPLFLIRAGSEEPVELTSRNIAIGIDETVTFSSITHNWNHGDTIILSTFAGQQINLKELLGEMLYAPPQKQADWLLRQLINLQTDEIGQRPITLIALQRSE